MIMVYSEICQSLKDNYNCKIGNEIIKMAKVREILAQNLKENRRKLGITQPELAERANLSTHYLAMIEIARRFPSADVLDRLAVALDISPNELFTVAVLPDDAMKQLQQAILENVSQAIESTLDKTVEKAIENALNKVIEKRCADGQQMGANLKGIQKRRTGEK